MNFVVITSRICRALRAAACKDRELAVNDQFGESLIFGPKIPFGQLFSKIIFKSSSDFLIFRDSQKFENAVKVRFFGQLKVQNKVRERTEHCQILKITSVEVKLYTNYEQLFLFIVHY